MRLSVADFCVSQPRFWFARDRRSPRSSNAGADPNDPRVGLKPGCAMPASRRAEHGAGLDAAQAGRLLRSEDPGRAMPAAARSATPAQPAPAAPRRRRATRAPRRGRPHPAASRRGSTSPTPTSRSAATHMVIGNFHGFNTYDIEAPKSPRLLASVVCPGGQGDVSIYGNLLFMSVEQTRGRVDCGTQGIADAGQQGALPRRPHLRHHRPEQAEAGRGGADLPRLAHAHARAEGQANAVRLRLGHRRRALGRGAGRLLRRRSEGERRTPRSSAST